MSAPLLGEIEESVVGERGFSPETKASLWRNGVAAAAFHHELKQSLTACGGTPQR
jgi:hypothetical protein